MDNLSNIKTKAQTLTQTSFMYVKSNWMIIVAVLLFGVLVRKFNVILRGLVPSLQNSKT
jgi:hypothetical protein